MDKRLMRSCRHGMGKVYGCAICRHGIPRKRTRGPSNGIDVRHQPTKDVPLGRGQRIVSSTGTDPALYVDHLAPQAQDRRRPGPKAVVRQPDQPQGGAPAPRMPLPKISKGAISRGRTFG
jgi:hypothetical protein